MAQIKFNLDMIRQFITLIITAANVLLNIIDTIERTVTNG